MRIFLIVILLMPTIVLSAGKHDSEAHEKVLMIGHDTPAGQIVTEFAIALKSGDQEKARGLLADDLIVYEGGGVERSAEEYASHHMKSDMKFLAALNTRVIEHQTFTHGEIAVSNVRTKMTGKYKDKNIDMITMQTMVLKKVNEEWRILRIHWS